MIHASVFLRRAFLLDTIASGTMALLLTLGAGELAPLLNLPEGCSFSPRCRYADDRCKREKPPLAAPESPDHQFACFHPIHAEARVGA